MPRTTIPDSQMALDSMMKEIERNGWKSAMADRLQKLGLVLATEKDLGTLTYHSIIAYSKDRGSGVILRGVTLGEVNAFLLGTQFKKKRRRTS